MRSLDYIRAEGFKSILTMNLELRDLNILIGANGAGKSNFMALFKLLNEIGEGNLEVYIPGHGGADAFLHFGRKTTERISINLLFEDNTRHYWCELTPTSDDGLIFGNEGIPPAQTPDYSSGTPNGALRLGNEGYIHGSSFFGLGSLGRGHRESKLLEPRAFADLVVEPIRNHLRSWKVYHFHDTSAGAKVRLTCRIEDNRVLHSDAGNLAAFLFLLQERWPSEYNNIVDATRLVFPFFDKFLLEPSRRNPEFIRLKWRERGFESDFDASVLSDGTLRFICLATLLLQPTLPSVILLDEPELGLHPFATNILAELFRGAAAKTQIIAATHSVSLVNQFGPEDVVVVEREPASEQGRWRTIFRRLASADLTNWLDDYGLGDLWEKNVIGGRP